ncbi:MAG TPA: hypothetical protein VFK69_04435 [Candidatus Eisenbacteria bacterium]|nr:hypothetical protein [Candidatus Eisenbacteria bacterium]
MSAAIGDRAADDLVIRSDAAAAPAAGAEPALAWRLNPWRENLPGALLLCIVELAIVGTQVRLLPPLTWIALIIAFNLLVGPAVLVRRYRVDAGGLAKRTLIGWERLPWERIRRAHPTPWGWFASPDPRASRLDVFRAFHLDVPRSLPNRAEVLRELRHRFALHGF